MGAPFDVLTFGAGRTEARLPVDETPLSNVFTPDEPSELSDSLVGEVQPKSPDQDLQPAPFTVVPPAQKTAGQSNGDPAQTRLGPDALAEKIRKLGATAIMDFQSFHFSMRRRTGKLDEFTREAIRQAAAGRAHVREERLSPLFGRLEASHVFGEIIAGGAVLKDGKLWTATADPGIPYAAATSQGELQSDNCQCVVRNAIQLLQVALGVRPTGKYDEATKKSIQALGVGADDIIDAAALRAIDCALKVRLKKLQGVLDRKAFSRPKYDLIATIPHDEQDGKTRDDCSLFVVEKGTRKVVARYLISPGTGEKGKVTPLFKGKLRALQTGHRWMPTAGEKARRMDAGGPPMIEFPPGLLNPMGVGKLVADGAGEPLAVHGAPDGEKKFGYAQSNGCMRMPQGSVFHLKVNYLAGNENIQTIDATSEDARALYAQVEENPKLHVDQNEGSEYLALALLAEPRSSRRR
jgi:hypothetical protein